jgi:type IV pilus assembly protein PilM
MASKVLSIEVGANFTRLCLTDFKVKSPKVYKYAKVETPNGAVVDGEIQLTPELVTLLRETISKNGMNTKQVVFPITSSKVASREVTVPMVKDKQVDQLLRANIKEYFPIDLTQHELGYISLGETEDGKMRKLLLLAVPKTLLDSYKKLASALNMQMVAADYSGNSIFEMVKNECKDGVKMVVKVDETSSIITVIENHSIVLQRNISYGLDEAINTIVKNPAFEANNYDEALELVFRKTCMKLSINAKDLKEKEEEVDADAQLLKAKQEVSASLGMFLNGIARIMDYYGSRNSGRTVDNIYITGLGADFSGLSKLVTNELGIKTVGLQHLEGQTLERSFKDGRFGEYITCVGATINPVGFVSNEKAGAKAAQASTSKSGASGLAIAVILLVAGIAVAAVLVGLPYMQLQSEKVQYAANTTKVNSMQEILTIYDQYLLEKNACEQAQLLDGYTQTHNKELVAFIEELEQKMPSNINVTSFTSGTENVTMNINVASKQEMANVVQQLRTFDSLSAVAVGAASDNVDEEGVHTVTFSVSCTYKTFEEIAAEEAAAAAAAQ